MAQNTKRKAAPPTLLVEVAGCPNACRHCFLEGTPRGDERGPDWARALHALFSEYARGRGEPPPEVSLYMQEPFYHSRWREMLELEEELNGTSGRDRLLKKRWRALVTVGWRIAREETFARWLKDYGYDVVQLTFFGLRDMHDWFARRRGAFDDLTRTMQRAADAGLVVMPSIMLHKRLIPELGDLLEFLARSGLPHVDKGRPWESLQTLDPTGRGYALEGLRPDVDDICSLSDEIVKRIEMPLRPESDYVTEILGEPEAPPEWDPSGLWLAVDLSGNAYPDHCSTLDEWHCLGNVFEEGPELIAERLHAGEPPGLRARRQLSERELAERYGDVAGRKVYGSHDQLVERWIRQWCESGAT